MSQSPQEERGSKSYQDAWRAVNVLIRSDGSWSGRERNVCYRNEGGGVFTDEEERAWKDPIIAQFDHQSHPLYASARLWDDGIIDPRKTRDVLGLSLSAALNKPIPDFHFGVFRM